MSSSDPFVKLYRETSCEHGQTTRHLVVVGAVLDATWCRSVVREEVTIDYEAAEERFIAARALIPALSMSDTRALAESIVDAALKSAGFTKKFASGESPTE